MIGTKLREVMAPRNHPKRDRQKLIRLLSLTSIELGVIYGCIMALTDIDPDLEKFEETLYIAKDRVLEIWQDWQNLISDNTEQTCARRARTRCRAIINHPSLSWEEKITQLGIAYSLSYMKRDRIYRILERPIKITRYYNDGNGEVCRYYWNEGEVKLGHNGKGENRICRAPLVYMDALKEAIAAGDSEEMLDKIRQTGKREVVAWVPSFEKFIKDWLNEN